MIAVQRLRLFIY